MGVECLVVNCRSKSKTNHARPIVSVSHELVTMHKFPGDPARYDKWIASVPFKKTEEVRKWTVICSLHFSEDMFASHKTGEVVSRRHLTKKAYPNINLELPESDEPLPEETSDPDPLAIPRVSTREKKEISPKEVARRRQHKTILQKMRRLNDKCKEQRQELNKLRRETMIKTKAAGTLGKLFSGPAGKLVEHLVKNLDKKKPGMRYGEAILTFSYSIYKHSQPAYQIVRSKLDLPNPSTLRKYAVLINNTGAPMPAHELVEDMGDMDEIADDAQFGDEPQEDDDKFLEDLEWLESIEN